MSLSQGLQCLRKDHYASSQGLQCPRMDQHHHVYQHQHHLYLEHEHEQQERMFRLHNGKSGCDGVIVAARVHVHVLDTDDAVADADDDAGPCEDIVVFAKTQNITFI